MKQKKFYQYIGKNGTVLTPVLLEEIFRYEKYELTAAAGKMLTNGERIVHSVLIPVDELDQWYEIDADNNN